MTATDEPVTHTHFDRQFYGRDKVIELPGDVKDCPQCRARDWVTQLLRQHVVPAGSNVVMANVNVLAAVLIEEFCLEDWFEQWDDPPEYLQ